MTVDSLLPFTSALLCGVLAVYVISNDTRSFARRVFAMAMMALAFEELFVALSAQAYLPADVLRWQRAKIIATAFVPASWLLFSLSYSRTGYSEFVARWKWIVVTAVALPVLLAVAFNAAFFPRAPSLHGDSAWSIAFGWPGQYFYIFVLIIYTMVLANLERTLRASSGAKRWQIKFLLLGLGCYLAFRIYSATQALLFSSLNSTLELTNSATLLVGCLFMIFSLQRAERFEVDIYLSNALVYNSITIVVVGLYLLMVGVLSVVFIYFTGDQFLSVLPFVVFLAFVALSILLFSAQARQRAVTFINRHLSRSAYDYRQVWNDFSQRTAQITDVRRLCATVADLVAETFGSPSVSVWLLANNPSQVVLAGSTSFSAAQGESLKHLENATAALIRNVAQRELPADLGGSETALRAELLREYPNYFRQAQIRYVTPLIANRRILGVLTMSDCLTKQSLSIQDLDLLRTIADQAANALLNRTLSEELLQAKELEAFQTMSAFFVHDLKNLAGGLSLMSRNLLRHMDNPEFRGDALTMLSQSVDKITELCGRMSRWGTDRVFRRVEVDLNELVNATLNNFNGSLKSSLTVGLGVVAKLSIDPDQVQKVLVNLILNADEAADAAGEIKVSTAQENGWVQLSVTDNGCGISRDFIEHRLFRPFQTSKKYGLGIGLFQCKQIIEGHRGRIEVESEEGKGSTFRVMMPVKMTDDSRPRT
jgi:putative PEP-CTERM system histidine kinase